jgi:hypothetical protein
MELHIKITGFLLVFLSLIHMGFPVRFDWKKELDKLTLINRQMMYVHTFFIGLMVLLMGVLCLACSWRLVNSELGRFVSAGLFIFWFVRLIFQFFVYSPELWKGKRFETVSHVLFSLLWGYFTVVFFIVGFMG